MALQNYIEDDWDDNALTNRSASQKDVFYQFSDGGTGDLLKGVYRPRWEIDQGSPSASNQQLEMPAGNTTAPVLITPSNIFTGSWSVDIRIVSSSTIDSVYLNYLLSDINNRYFYRADYDNRLRLQKIENSSVTTLIEVSWDGDTSNHRYKVTKNSYNTHEAFYDGASKGTVTDSFNPEAKYLRLASGIDSESEWDNLLVR